MRFVKIRTQFIGFHSWKDAPEKTAFLRDKHRHLFKVSVKMRVFHNDREVEFFALQDRVIRWSRRLKKDDVGSCEMVAEKLLKILSREYPGRLIEVTISEDGESDGIVDNSEEVILYNVALQGRKI